MITLILSAASNFTECGLPTPVLTLFNICFLCVHIFFVLVFTESLKESLSGVERKVADCKTLICGKEDEVNSLQKQLKEAQVELAESLKAAERNRTSKDLEKVNKKVSDLWKEICSKDERFQICSFELANLKTRLEVSQDARRKDSQAAEDLEAKLKEAQETLAKLGERLEQKSLDGERDGDKLTATEEKVAKLEEELRQTSAKLEAAERDKNKLKAAEENLVKLEERLKQKSLNEERDGDKLTATEEKVAKLEEELRQASAKLEAAKRDKKRLVREEEEKDKELAMVGVPLELPFL